jgi:hypothetical protein
MSVRFEMGDHNSIDVASLWHNTRQPVQNQRRQDQNEDENAHTKTLRRPEIRRGCVKARRERDATDEKGNAQIRKERKDSEEPEAGDRYRPVRGAEEGREDPSPACGTKELQANKAKRLMGPP